MRDFVERGKRKIEKEDEKRDDTADAGIWDEGLVNEDGRRN